MSGRRGAAQWFWIPGLARFYDVAVPAVYVLVRYCLGPMLALRGTDKFFGDGVLHTMRGLTNLEMHAHDGCLRLCHDATRQWSVFRRSPDRHGALR